MLPAGWAGPLEQRRGVLFRGASGAGLNASRVRASRCCSAWLSDPRIPTNDKQVFPLQASWRRAPSRVISVDCYVLGRLLRKKRRRARRQLAKSGQSCGFVASDGEGDRYCCGRGLMKVSLEVRSTKDGVHDELKERWRAERQPAA